MESAFKCTGTRLRSRHCGAAVQSLPKKSSRSREMQPDSSELQLGTALIRKCSLDDIVSFDSYSSNN